MKVINKVEVKLDEFPKCSAFFDSDCPLGQIYDFSCALKQFVSLRIKEEEEKKKESVSITELEEANGH